MKKLAVCLTVLILLALSLGGLRFRLDQKQRADVMLAAAERQGKDHQRIQELEGRIQELMRELAETKRLPEDREQKTLSAEDAEGRETGSPENAEIRRMEWKLIKERKDLEAVLAARDLEIEGLEKIRVYFSGENQKLLESITRHQADLDVVNAEAFDLKRQLKLVRKPPLTEEEFNRLDPPEQTAERLEQALIPALIFKGEKASDVFTFISNVIEEQDGAPLSFLLDLPEQAEPEVTISLRRVSSKDALDFVCDVTGLDYSFTEKGEIYVEKDHPLKPDFQGNPFDDPDFELPRRLD